MAVIKSLGSSANSDNLGKKLKCRTGCEEPIAARNHFATASPPKPVGLPKSQSRNECSLRLVGLKRVEFKLRLGHPLARWVILRQLSHEIPILPHVNLAQLKSVLVGGQFAPHASRFRCTNNSSTKRFSDSVRLCFVSLRTSSGADAPNL